MRPLPTLVLLFVAVAASAQTPKPVEADFIVKNFHFRSGEVLPETRIHYATIGTLKKSEHGTNAVLVLHGTGGSLQQFLNDRFAGVLFAPGGALDATRYFIVIPDNIGHGKSSKPSDGLRAKFPHYDYDDMVELQHRLLADGLGVDRLHLVMGTSMGGMHSWVWGETHPEFMDALMPLACLPVAIVGRNRLWRRMVVDAIQEDPEWKGGEYAAQPKAGLRTAVDLLMIAGSAPAYQQRTLAGRDTVDRYLASQIENRMKTTDANDEIYALQASEDYHPAPDLEKIQCHLTAINFADDLINPNDVEGILQTNIKRVKFGRAVVYPESDMTHGHQTHTYPVVWQSELSRLLRESEH